MIKDYIGERFGEYVLTKPLGEGGFARVYLGEHIKVKTPALGEMGSSLAFLSSIGYTFIE